MIEHPLAVLYHRHVAMDRALDHALDDFQESQHPRSHGKFTSGGGAAAKPKPSRLMQLLASKPKQPLPKKRHVYVPQQWLYGTSLDRALDQGLDRAFDKFDPGKHPRGGQPKNVGQFSKGAGGKKAAEPAKKKTAPAPHKVQHLPKHLFTGKAKVAGALGEAPFKPPLARKPPAVKSTGVHPGKGYSKDAFVGKDGRIYTKNVEDAALALSQNRKVELDQPRKISTLIQQLGKMAAEAIEHGDKARVYDLCNVSVRGTNLFCAQNVGVKRINMPQVSKAMTSPFIEYLQKKGYDVDETDEYASFLHATQTEIDGAKVARVAREKMMMDGGTKIKRLVVSNDNYILDGHHHWAAKVGLDARYGNLMNDTKMRIARVNISITKLLEEAEEFTGGKGKVAVGAP